MMNITHGLEKGIPKMEQVENKKENRLLKAIKKSFDRFKKHKVTFILSLIFSALSLSCFSSYLVIKTGDYNREQLNLAYKNGDKTVLLTGQINKINHQFLMEWVPIKGFYYENSMSYLNDSQREALRIYGRLNLSFSLGSLYSNDDLKLYAEDVDKTNPYEYMAYNDSPINRFVLLDTKQDGERDHEKNTLDRLSLTKDERVTLDNRLPENNKEIAISDYQADMFIKYGLIDKENQTDGKTNSIDELLGKKILGRTIVGILKSDEDKEKVKERCDKDPNNTLIKQEYHPLTSAYIANTKDALVDDYIANKDYYPYESIYKLTGNKRSDLNFINSLKTTTIDSSSHYWHLYKKEFVSIITKYYNPSFDRSRNYKMNGLALFYLMLFTVIFFILDVLFLSIFMYKSKEEDARFIDEAINPLFIQLPGFILSIIISIIVVVSLNASQLINPYSFGLLPIFLVIILIFTIINLSTLIAIKKNKRIKE